MSFALRVLKGPSGFKKSMTPLKYFYKYPLYGASASFVPVHRGTIPLMFSNHRERALRWVGHWRDPPIHLLLVNRIFSARHRHVIPMGEEDIPSVQRCRG